MRKVSIIKDPGFYRRVLVIMLPVAIQQAINMGVNMLDTMMLGSFGEMQLSASSLANQYYNFFTIFCMGNTKHQGTKERIEKMKCGCWQKIAVVLAVATCQGCSCNTTPQWAREGLTPLVE